MSTSHQNTETVSESDLKKESSVLQIDSQQKIESTNATNSLKSPRTDKPNDEKNEKTNKEESQIQSGQNESVLQKDASVSPNPPAAESNASSSTTLKSWERPWTLEELRQGTQSWTLASDSGVIFFSVTHTMSLGFIHNFLRITLFFIFSTQKRIQLKLPFSHTSIIAVTEVSDRSIQSSD
jgi:hypothetical protein